uniref:hypothetical protein n=1 Tax=Ornithobacterium rhinotracheale TaxID=28251 RepID=UPI0021AA6DEB|nr:hypothetical protein [Ornithobacterium rhinotracheale]
MKKQIILLSTLFFLSANIAYAQQTIFNNNSVVEMKQAGLSDDLIKTKIATENSQFDTSTNAILALKKQGISDELISLMIQKNSALKAYEDRTNTDTPAEETHIVTTIQPQGDDLVIGFVNNTKKTIKKGANIKVYLPAQGKDFMFIEQKKGLLNAKLLGSVAEAVGTGALAVGVGTNNAGTALGALKVLQKAEAVRWGADALDKIDKLPISKKAKKIAGKEMKVLDWEATDDGYQLLTEFNGKKYTIQLHEAIFYNEISL